MNIQEKLEAFERTSGGWCNIILSTIDYLPYQDDEKIAFEIVEKLPMKLIKYSDIEDDNEELYCSDEMIEMVCNKIISCCNEGSSNFLNIAVANAAKKILSEGY